MNGTQKRLSTPVRHASRSPSPVRAIATIASNANASQYTGLESAPLNLQNAHVISIEKNKRNVRPQSATFKAFQVAKTADSMNTRASRNTAVAHHLHPGMARLPGSRHLPRVRRRKTRRNRKNSRRR